VLLHAYDHQRGPQVAFEVAPAPVGIGVKGQVVVSIKPGSQADELGMQVGWRVVRVGDQCVSSTAEVTRELKKMKGKGKKYDITFIIPMSSKLAIPVILNPLMSFGENTGFGGRPPVTSCPFVAQELTMDEYTIYEKDFNRFDVNGNGRLDRNEVMKLAEEQMGGIYGGRPLHPKEVQAWCEMIDRDKDDNVSLSEYIAWIMGGNNWVIKEEKDWENKRLRDPSRWDLHDRNNWH